MTADILIIFGTRPEAIKLASTIQSLKNRGQHPLTVWSGQHYDYEMYKIFFQDLDLPDPDYDLRVGSSSHAVQTADIIRRFEKVVKRVNPRIVVAQGDTNTVVAAALTSIKLHVPFAHVEAGMRSFNKNMPEEANRIVADALSDLHFAPTDNAALNLLYEGVSPSKIYVTGDTLVDVIFQFLKKAEIIAFNILNKLGLKNGKYVVLTIHRAENTNNIKRLRSILEAIQNVANEIPVVFPIHPRTRKYIKAYGFHNLLKQENIIRIKPLSYLDFLALLTQCHFVITDSGGVQEEALTLKVPCITLRYSTEWIETIKLGGNLLVGAEKTKILDAVKYVVEHNKDIKDRISNVPNPLGDGQAGERIAKILVEYKKRKYSDRFSNSDINKCLSFRLVSGKIFEGLTIQEVTEKFGILVTLIYDDGKPTVVYPDMIIKKEWIMRVWGSIENLRNLGGMNAQL